MRNFNPNDASREVSIEMKNRLRQLGSEKSRCAGKKTPADRTTPLRRQAEARLQKQQAGSKSAVSDQRSAEETQQFLHELQVHQIELEIQNEELRRMQVALDAQRARYFDLYDNAPVGYCTLSKMGLLLEGNLTAAALLGCARRTLTQQRFAQFISRADQDTYYQHFKKLKETGLPQRCDLRLVNPGGAEVWVELSFTADRAAEPLYRVVLSDATARKQLEHALLQSEEKFRLTFMEAPLGIALIDSLTGRICEVNSKYAEITGRSKAEMERIDWMSITHPDDVQADLDNMAQLNAGKITGFNMDKRYHRPDGTVVWISLAVVPLAFADKCSPRHLAMIADITEQKRSEDLTAAQLRLHAFADTHSLDDFLRKLLDELELITGSQIGFYHFVEADQETLTLQMWSTRTEKEMCRAEGKGRHYNISAAGVWVDCIRERRPVIHNNYAALPHRKDLPAGHAPVLRELVVPVLRNDQIVAILGVGNKPTDYDDHDVRTVTFLADLAWEYVVRKRNEVAIRESEFRWKFALEGAGDGVWDWDLASNTVVYSRQWKQMLGYAETEIGTSLAEWHDRVHPADLPKTMAAVQAHLKGRTPQYSSEHRLRCRDGQWKWILARGVVVTRNPAGQPARLIGTHTDIAARKEVEELIHSFAQKILLAREEERKQVAAALHHDVGSLAIGVTANLAALAANLRAGQVGDGLKLVERAQQVFNAAVAHLKGVATQLRPPELDVLGLRAALQQHCRQFAGQAGIPIRFTAQLGRTKVPAEAATILFRVAQEALTNAIKHGRAQGIAVNLRAAPAMVTLAVQDDGVGFAPAQPPPKGTIRIGVRVMQEMTVAAGGKFTLESQPGRGTLVRVRLPLSAGAGASRTRPPAQPKTARGK